MKRTLERELKETEIAEREVEGSTIQQFSLFQSVFAVLDHWSAAVTLEGSAILIYVFEVSFELSGTLVNNNLLSELQHYKLLFTPEQLLPSIPS